MSAERPRRSGSTTRTSARPAAKPRSPTQAKRVAKSKPAATSKSVAASRENRVAGMGKKGERVVLLSGGNPQIAKADGDAPVQAYIERMPGWKRDVGRWLDALIERAVPGVRRAVKWNSPLYGVDGSTWFLGVHVYTRYVKVSFFRGASLRPLPPGPSKSPEARYLDVHEGERIDEAQLASWVKQAAALPGWMPGKPL